jgi:thiol-disulfide isomerase/thioredoxin
MTWRRSSLLVVALGVAILAAGALLWRQLTSDATSPSGGSTDSAPLLALTLPDAAGEQETLGQWKGKVLIVNFWATWCEPCKEEMPRFIKLQDEYAARGLQFVGVAIDQADKVRAFAKDIGLNYPTLVGGYGAIELSKTLGNNVGALPFTVVLDRSGAVVHTQLGPLKDQQLLSIIKQLT